MRPLAQFQIRMKRNETLSTVPPQRAVVFPHHGRVSLEDQHVRRGEPQQSPAPSHETRHVTQRPQHCSLQQNTLHALAGMLRSGRRKPHA